jgi:hypothetical protein
VLRQSRPPRRPCGPFPTASSPGPPVPFAPEVLGTRAVASERASCRTTMARDPAVRRQLLCQARLPRPASYEVVMAGTFLRAVGRGLAGYLGRCCPCAGRRSLLSQRRPTPRSVLVVPDELRYPDLPTTGLASSCVTRPPYDLPSTTASSPRMEHRRAGAHRGQPAWALPAGRSPALPTPSSASNRRLVSPLTSSTHSPAKGTTGVAQFRRAAPAGPPRDHSAK